MILEQVGKQNAIGINKRIVIRDYAHHEETMRAFMIQYKDAADISIGKIKEISEAAKQTVTPSAPSGNTRRTQKAAAS